MSPHVRQGNQGREGDIKGKGMGEKGEREIPGHSLQSNRHAIPGISVRQDHDLSFLPSIPTFGVTATIPTFISAVTQR